MLQARSKCSANNSITCFHSGMEESDCGCVTAEQRRVFHCCQVHFRIWANVMKSGGDAGCSLLFVPALWICSYLQMSHLQYQQETTFKAFQEHFQTRFSTPVILSMQGGHSCWNNRKTLTGSPLIAPTMLIGTIGGTPLTSSGPGPLRIQYNEWERRSSNAAYSSVTRSVVQEFTWIAKSF